MLYTLQLLSKAYYSALFACLVAVVFLQMRKYICSL